MIQTAWARVLLHSLAEAGIDQVVVSPGSRSTPFVAAALEAGLDCRPIVDERAAGFYALGRARVTGTPPLLICSSGTAGAHYYPAVIEAAETFTPLLVLTADRPPELHRCQAAQTIDQTRLFGEHARAFFDLGVPGPSRAALQALRRKAAQAVATAVTGLPGPVHLNAPARKPLEPSPRLDGATGELARAVLAHPLTRAPAPRRRADDQAIALIAAVCRDRRRGVIVAGPAPIGRRHDREAVAALADATGYPLLAEATSQLRLTGAGRQPTRCDGFDLVLTGRADDPELRPELILQLDRPPTSAGFARYLAAHPDCPRIVIAEHGWGDPHSDAAALITGEVGDTVARVAAELAPSRPEPDPDWAAAWRAADGEAWRRVEAALAAGETMTEGQAMRAIVAALPAGALLAVANSTPVRDLDTYCPGGLAEVSVLGQRGANGIDGLIAGAAGAASAGDRPVVLAIGDVAFAHDLGGLAAAAELRAPLCVCVIDNRGGRIFERLPVSEVPALAGAFERYWLTPPGLDFAAAAATHGHRFARVARPDRLGHAVAEALSRPGCTVIQAEIDPARGATARRRLADPTPDAPASPTAIRPREETR